MFPLAIRWPKGIKNPGTGLPIPVNLSDLAPTFLEAAGLKVPGMMTANSLLNDVIKDTNPRQPVWLPSSPWSVTTGAEREEGISLSGNRTKEYMYILNHKPDRWPAGNPDRTFCSLHPLRRSRFLTHQDLVDGQQGQARIQTFLRSCLCQAPRRGTLRLEKGSISAKSTTSPANRNTPRFKRNSDNNFSNA